MRGELLFKALGIIEKFTYTTTDFLEAFAASNKSNYLPLHRFRPKEYDTPLTQTLRVAIEKKQQIYELFHRMRQQGLMEKSKKGRNGILIITRRGLEKKKELGEKLATRLSVNEYQKITSPELVIVSFDIPEKEKHKREWLRSVIKNLGFQMLQKSVWIGKIKIPKELVKDLQRLNLLSCVEIFAVTKSGTIKHLA